MTKSCLAAFTLLSSSPIIALTYQQQSRHGGGRVAKAFGRLTTVRNLSIVEVPLITEMLPSIGPSLIAAACFYWQLKGNVRGKLEVPSHHLDIRKSTVPNAGRGLFATVDLRAGTLLGTYPGVVHLSPQKWAETKGLRCPSAHLNVWTLGSGILLDPSNDNGEVCDVLMWGPFSVDTRLTRINEPAPGTDQVNVAIEESADDAFFILDRDVVAGDELFIDYGNNYRRDGYSI